MIKTMQQFCGRKILPFLTMFAVLLTMLLCGTALTVSAANKTYRFEMDRKENIEIVILYEDKAPKISVKGPSKTYSKDADYAKVEKQTGRLYLYVKEAESGAWTITSDKEIDYTVLVWQEGISVTSFVQEAPKNDKIKVKALVESEEEKSYEWYIYATADASITGVDQKILLNKTNARTKKESTSEVSIKDLPDGQWTLTMEAVVNNGNDLTSEAHATADKPFTVSGHTKKGDPEKIYTHVSNLSNVMHVIWKDLEEDYDHMLVSVVDANGELLLYENYDKDVVGTDFFAEGEVTVRLMPLKHDKFDTIYTLKLSFASPFIVTIDTPETTSDLMVRISYQSPEDWQAIANVKVNGKVSQYLFKGSGTISLPLEPMSDNEVVVDYAINGNDFYTVSKTIHVQSASAFIEFYGVGDKVVTDKDTIVICGKTEPGVALMLNDNAVSVESSGEFTAEAKLTNGENVLLFSIESPYGVRTERVVSVVRTAKGSSATATMNQTDIPAWIPWALAGFMLLMTIGAIFLTVMLIRKRQYRAAAALWQSVRMFLLLMTVLLLTAGGFCLYQYIRVSSTIEGEHLIERLSGSDYDGLNQVLQVREAWFGRMLTLLIIAAVCMALWVLLLVLHNKRHNNNKPSNKPPQFHEQQKPKKSKKSKTTETPAPERPVFDPTQMPSSTTPSDAP